MKYFVLILLIIIAYAIEKNYTFENFTDCNKIRNIKINKIVNNKGNNCIKYNKQCGDDCYETFISKPYIWVFIDKEVSSRNWSDFYSRRSNQNLPDYIQLCIESLKKNNKEEFNIQILNENNIKIFIRKCYFKWNDRKIDYNIKKQFVKYYILNKFGGLWLEPDNIVFKSLMPIYNKLKQYDIVAFNCNKNEIVCNPNTSSSFINIACKPDLEFTNKILSNIITNINNIHNNYTFYNLKKIKISEYNNYKNNICLLDSNLNGSRDYNGKLITIENLVSNNHTGFKNADKIFFISCDKTNIKNKTKYKWLEKLDKNELLNSNMWISKLFRFALGLNQVYIHTKINNEINNNKEIYNLDFSNNINSNNILKETNKIMYDPSFIVTKESYRNC